MSGMTSTDKKAFEAMVGVLLQMSKSSMQVALPCVCMWLYVASVMWNGRKQGMNAYSTLVLPVLVSGLGWECFVLFLIMLRLVFKQCCRFLCLSSAWGLERFMFASISVGSQAPSVGMMMVLNVWHH